MTISNLKKSYRGKKVLVTGGAGFIGSFLVAELFRLGVEVAVLVRSGTDLWRLRGTQKRIKIISADLGDAAAVKKMILAERPSLIFHLASFMNNRRALQTLDEAVKENFQNTANLLAAAAEIQPERFVHFGTIEEYGSGASPFSESQRESPISPYSLSKTMATNLVLLFHKIVGLKACVIRPAATFGPKQGLGMLVSNLIISALAKKDFDMNPGEHWRDFLYVEDLIGGILAAGIEKKAIGEIINLGSNTKYRVKDIVNKINKLMGKPIKINFGKEPYRPLDVARFYMNSDKAKKLLGWQAQTALEAALAKTIRWYQENRLPATKK